MYEPRYVTIALIYWWALVAGNDVVRNEDICGVHNGRRLYLELGEKGILYAKNVSFAKNEPRQETSQAYASSSNSSHEQCSLELVTCPSCVIIATFRSIALSHHCGDGGVTMDSPCRCDYVWISEPPFEDVSGTPFCGLYAPLIYRSSTRTLSITLLYSQSHRHAFTLEYTAERNRLHLKGTELMTGGAKGLNSTGGGILTSPFFPARYPRDLGLEYIVTCPNEAPSCRIRLLFSDFQLATVSIMEFYDWNGQRLDVSSGARFRPPVIVSSGPSLLIRFYANGGTGLGYKAFYSFVIGHLVDKSVQPITDCGGYVENLGGAITMMDMVGEGAKTYDCVWLIRPPKNFLHMKTHMYLKVVTFADMAGNTELVVKQGPTSALLPLEILRHPTRQLQPPRHREHIAPVTSGFHVSLRGVFGPSSHLAIAYAAFSYTDCFAGSDFLCQNHRCIPSQLNCDGFDHCGDNSDEPASCFRDWELEPQDRKWHMNKPNYYFPKIDRYPDLKTATLVFVASSLGLIILISALIILLYRMGARARQQRELQSRLQTISELLVFDISDGARIDEISVSDEPPVYEAPPGYDEVVKLSLEAESVRRKKRSLAREARNRNSPGQCSLDQSSTCLVSEGAGTSRGSQTTPIQGRQVPESPPPPYVTPPGTFPRNFIIPGLNSCPSGSREHVEAHVEEIVRVRRGDWLLRQPGEFSRSLSLTEPLAPEGLESDVDAEVLGAYLRDRVASSPICTAEYSDPQPRNSLDASTGTVPECARDAGTVGQEAATSEQEEQRGQGEPEAEADGAEDRTEEECCSCQGACGCASNTRSQEDPTPEPEPEEPSIIVTTTGSVSAICSVFNQLIASIAPITPVPLRRRPPAISGLPPKPPAPLVTPSTSANSNPPLAVSEPGTSNPYLTIDSGDKSGEEESNESENDAFQSFPDVREILDDSQDELRAKESRRNNDDDDTSSTKSTIVRLLRAGKLPGGSSGSGSASTAASTPCNSIRRSKRKFSACSRDSYMTKISTASSCNSYEKLQDEFEIVSETASTMANTPSGSPKRIPRHGVCRRSRRYGSCDLESLYEGMKVLDNFLIRRGLAVGHGRKHSVAVMLFGTPEHVPHRRRYAEDAEDVGRRMRETARIWRSNDDTLSN